jgi:hypothetical protein
MKLNHSKISSLAIVFIFLLFTLVCFKYYLQHTLEGNIDNHILAGEMFGVPDAIAQHGVKPMYYGNQTGWDGQFYYYMSNDLLGRTDAPAHFDANAYRYQRIGLAAYTAAISKVLGRSWVSPAFYFFNYLLLLSIATYFGTKILSARGTSPWWILLWSLSVGTQVTLFSALPDAAADAFLIIGLWGVISRRNIIVVFAMTLSALSREVYLIFPLMMFAMTLFVAVKRQRLFDDFSVRNCVNLTVSHAKCSWLLIPVIVTLGWRMYVERHFHVVPTSQAYGILGFPLNAWFSYFKSGLLGHHLLVAPGWPSYAEAASLLYFLLATLLIIALSTRAVISNLTNYNDEFSGVASASLIIGLMYLCFGPTVIMHYTGYLKAASLFSFLIPLFFVYLKNKNNTYRFIALFLMLGLVGTTSYNLLSRVLANQPHSIAQNEKCYGKPVLLRNWTVTPALFDFYEPIVFSQAGNSDQFIRQGWFNTEGPGRWSIGDYAEVSVPISAAVANANRVGLNMDFIASPLFDKPRPVKLFINDELISTFTPHTGFNSYTFGFSPKVKSLLHLRFDFGSVPPLSSVTSIPDHRRLGIFVNYMKIVEAPLCVN